MFWFTLVTIHHKMLHIGGYKEFYPSFKSLVQRDFACRRSEDRRTWALQIGPFETRAHSSPSLYFHHRHELHKDSDALYFLRKEQQTFQVVPQKQSQRVDIKKRQTETAAPAQSLKFCSQSSQQRLFLSWLGFNHHNCTDNRQDASLKLREWGISVFWIRTTVSRGAEPFLSLDLLNRIMNPAGTGFCSSAARRSLSTRWSKPAVLTSGAANKAQLFWVF